MAILWQIEKLLRRACTRLLLLRRRRLLRFALRCRITQLNLCQCVGAGERMCWNYGSLFPLMLICSTHTHAHIIQSTQVAHEMLWGERSTRPLVPEKLCTHWAGRRPRRRRMDAHTHTGRECAYGDLAESRGAEGGDTMPAMRNCPPHWLCTLLCSGDEANEWAPWSEGACVCVCKCVC